MKRNIKDAFNLELYDYQIPKALIAQEPVSPRDSSRLLVIDKAKKTIKESIFKDIVEYFKKGDVLVLNDTKVIRARLMGKRRGIKLEILLLKEREKGVWEVLVNPGKRAHVNDEIIFGSGKLKAKIIDRTKAGSRILEFSSTNLDDVLKDIGKVPLPPYIKKDVDNDTDYQTVYAKTKGAIAAPTAGFHFTNELINKIKQIGVKIVYVTLHCGLATFRPVKTEDIRNHKIDTEWIELLECSAKIINAAKRNKRRVIAVGTTAVRTLESVCFVGKGGVKLVKPSSFQTNLYIVPGYKFKIVDALITNFHTPRSTNLILASTFCGLALLKEAYDHAKSNNFRFYSFGDVMFIV